MTTQNIPSKIGLDMQRWPTVKHFASWLGLSPHNEVSGGKVLRTRTKKTKNRAAIALRLAAQKRQRLGWLLRRLQAKHRSAKAITATAHKLARIIYYMLRDRIPYQDPGAQRYEQQYQERVLRNLTRKAQRLGMQLVPLPDPSAHASPLLAPT